MDPTQPDCLVVVPYEHADSWLGLRIVSMTELWLNSQRTALADPSIAQTQYISHPWSLAASRIKREVE